MKKLLLCLTISLSSMYANQSNFATATNVFNLESMQKLTPTHQALLATYVNTLIIASKLQDRPLLDTFAFINGILYGGRPAPAAERITKLCQIMEDIGIQLDACSTQPASFNAMDIQ